MLVLLADEIAGMARFRRETGHLPFDGGPGTESYRSLTADLDASLARLGPRLREIASAVLGGAYESQWSSPVKGTEPPWTDLFDAGDVLETRLRDPESLIAALDDALEATRRERLEDALVALAPALDELRAIAELQRGPWVRTRNTIEHHLTIYETRDDGSTSPGRYPPGTEPAMILGALREALRVPIPEQRWAVWISTLAGPSPETNVPTAAIVSGPIAVSGRACTGEIGSWLVRVQEDLATAFGAAGLEVPPDVVAMGEPARFRGSVVLDGEQLWSHIASPPSFVARVAVRAKSSEEAIDKAREALRAVYGFSEPGLPGDVRPDAIVWTQTGGWALPNITARHRSVGELRAPRHAARAVAGWAQDLGSPLDTDKLDLLRSRALVRTASVSPEVRLMRAFASLEALTPAGSKLDHVAGRLWVRTLRGEARTLLLHLLNRARDPHALGPPRDGASWEDREARVTHLSRSSPRWGTELLDAIDGVLEVIHPDAMEPALSRATRTYLTDPTVCDQAQARHAAAVKRARRHRNLTTHGHRLSDRALTPTVAFLADQLECAITATADDGPATSWLGSLASDPDLRYVGANVAELLRR